MTKRGWLKSLGGGWSEPAEAIAPADVCVSRGGLSRAEHELDKDGRCVFCDFLQPEQEPEP